MDSRNTTQLRRYIAMFIVSVSFCFVSGCGVPVTHNWPPDVEDLPDSKVATIHELIPGPHVGGSFTLENTHYIAQITSGGRKSYDVDARFHKPFTKVKHFAFPLRLMPGENIIALMRRPNIGNASVFHKLFHERHTFELEAGKSYNISFDAPHLIEIETPSTEE